MSNKEQLQNNNVQLANLIHTLQGKAIGGGGGAPADWNAGEGEPGHVLNRTHYEDTAIGYVLEEVTLTEYEDMAEIGMGYIFPTEQLASLVVGNTYTVMWNGTPYECVCQVFYNMPVLGNAVILGESDTGEPFIIFVDPYMGNAVCSINLETVVTVSVSGTYKDLKKIDPKFVDIDIVNGKAPYSLRTTNAWKEYEYYSMGNRSIAFGEIAAARGNDAIALGKYANADGESSIAIGAGAEAHSAQQTVFGSYNIADDDSKYVCIFGNGPSATEKSNAHTIDWSGNGWFAGTVEGTALILKSPNGTRYQITVDDSGTLSASAVTE